VVGQELARYQITAMLGEGGMGVVSQANWLKAFGPAKRIEGRMKEGAHVIGCEPAKGSK
jgi:hypothetical protein